MNSQDKELLLKDLCARLPYGVKVKDEFGRTNKLVIGNADLIRLYYNDFSIYSEKCISLPCLRPMSSMTEEERKEYKSYQYHFSANSLPNYEGDFVFVDEAYEFIDWLNAHHFDYRGLIDKGLAIAVTEENNPYE